MSETNDNCEEQQTWQAEQEAQEGGYLPSPPIDKLMRDEELSDDQVKALILAGAAAGEMSVKDYDFMGEGPLHWAAANGRSGLIAWLVNEMGMEVDARNKYAETALDAVCQYAFGAAEDSIEEAAIELLRSGSQAWRSKGPRPAGERKTGERSGIHWAAGSGMLRVCEALVERGADIGDGEWGHTPWAYAIVAVSTPWGDSPTGGGNWGPEGRERTREILDGLLALGGRADDEGEGGASALALAAARGSPMELIEYLLSRGADPNHRDDKGVTPLIAACAQSEPELYERAERIAVALLEAGADPGAADNKGRSPSDLASWGGAGCARALGAARAWVERAELARDTSAPSDGPRASRGRPRGRSGGL